MKTFRIALLPVALLAAAAAFAGDSKPAAGKKSAAELEKEKAMANPYPNDLGPAKLPDDYVASMPKDKKAGYDLLLARCAQCHTAARPLNSRFVEVDGKEAGVAKLKADQPDLFKDQKVWQIEGAIWNRYVKRMMAKPGCKISSAEGKKIWEFLVWDSGRKVGANAATWKAHRQKLLAEFKEKHPERYKTLEHENDL